MKKFICIFLIILFVLTTFIHAEETNNDVQKDGGSKIKDNLQADTEGNQETEGNVPGEDEDEEVSESKSTKEIIKDLKANESKDLFLRNSEISVEEAQEIKKLLETNSYERFVLTNNKDLKEETLKVIGQGLAAATKLRVFGLTKNKLTDELVTKFLQHLKNHPGLKKFYIYDTNTADQGMKNIIDILRTIKTLEKLAIIENPISNEGVIEIAKFTQEMESLTSLILRDVKFDSKGAKALGNALKRSNLQKVDLSENGFDEEGAVFIGNALSGNSHLTHVELSYNGITEKTIGPILEGLENNDNIVRVDLSENQINDVGATGIVKLLAKNTILKKLDISNCGITKQGTGKIIDALQKNKSLKQLYYFRNEISNAQKEEAKKLTNVIKHEDVQPQFTQEIDDEPQEPEDDGEENPGDMEGENQEENPEEKSPPEEKDEDLEKHPLFASSSAKKDEL